MPDAQKANLIHFPAAQELGGRVIDQEIAESHQQIEAHTSAATNEPVIPGSSIPPIQTDPMKVINPMVEETANVQEELEGTIPKSYKRSKLPVFIQKFLGMFGNLGKDTQETIAQHTGQSYRTTEGTEFLGEINKKAQQENPIDELKKAA